MGAVYIRSPCGGSINPVIRRIAALMLIGTDSPEGNPDKGIKIEVRHP